MIIEKKENFAKILNFENLKICSNKNKKPSSSFMFPRGKYNKNLLQR